MKSPAAVLFVLIGAACAQTTQGLISGRLLNSRTGKPLPPATVLFWNLATNSTGATHSDGAGFYYLPLLSPGHYHIRAEAIGCQAQDLFDLELLVAGRLDLDFRLRPLSDIWESGQYRSVFLPGVRTVLTFYGPDLDTTRSASFEAQQGRSGTLESTVSEVIDPVLIRDLPLAGRDVYSALVLQPGVTSDNATGRGLGLAAVGQRPSASNFMLDGLENNNYLITGPLTPIAPEAIQEYRVSVNNFSAEYGRTSGYLANAITRAGGASFHGTAYLYLKNEALNANGFQRNCCPTDPADTAGLRLPFKELQPGFQAGGPLLKDRFFWSSALEYLRDRGSLPPHDYILPAQSFLAALDTSTPGGKLLSQYKPLSVAGSTATVAARLEAPQSLNRLLALERLDYSSPSSRHRWMGRVAVARMSEPDFMWTPYHDFISPLTQNSLSLALSHIWSIRPSLTNELKAGYSREDLTFNRKHPEVPVLAPPGVLLPGSADFYPFHNESATQEALDNLVWTRGRHLIAIGGGLLWRDDQGYLGSERDGRYSFNSFSDFIVGKAALLEAPLLRASLQSGQTKAIARPPDFDREYRYRQYFLFAQDTMRVSSRFTLNYGVQLEQYGAPRNTGKVKDILVDLGAGDTFVQKLSQARLNFTATGDEALYQPDNHDWGVRAGFSFDLMGTGRTVLRGAYGIFYDRPFDNLWQTLRNNNIAFGQIQMPAAITDYSGGIAPAQSADKAITSSVPGMTLFEQKLRNGYAHTFFLGVQQRIAPAWTLEVNGLGSLGRRLITSDEINRLIPTLGVKLINNALPINVAYRGSQGASDYYALTALTRFRARSAQFQAAYTWSHAIDLQSEPLRLDLFDFGFTGLRGASATLDLVPGFNQQFDSRGDRGNSNFDQRHSLALFGLWEIPSTRSLGKASFLMRDWTVSGIAAFRSGFPFTVLDPRTGTRVDILNPEAVALVTPQPVAGGVLLLNKAAFSSAVRSTCRTQPDTACFGNEGRNALRGPGFYSFDFSVGRSFALPGLTEAARLTIRADAFNILNHANLNTPSFVLGFGNFGIAQYGRLSRPSNFPSLNPLDETARQIQLSARFEF